MNLAIFNCEFCINKVHTHGEHKALFYKEYTREYGFYSRKMKSGNNKMFKPKHPFTGEPLELSMIEMPQKIEEFRSSVTKINRKI